MEDAYAVQAWYPAARGPLERPLTLRGSPPGLARRAARAWSSLEPGRALLVAADADRRSGLRGPTAASSLAGLERSLPGAGRVDRWLVLPGTGGSHVLLPAGSRAGFRAGLHLLPAGRRRWRVLRALLRHACGPGLLGYLGLPELLVAVKGPVGRPFVPLLRKAVNPPLAVALGVPGPFRKAIVVVGGRDHAQSVLKLSLDEPSRARVRHEARVLQRLTESPRAGPFAPSLLGRGCDGGVEWIALEFVPGRRSSDRVRREHLAFLGELHAGTWRRVPAEALAYLRSAVRRADRVADSVDRAWLAAMRRLSEALHARLAGREIPCALAHGDFTPWNLISTGDGLRAVDWELSIPQAPVLHDLIHFHFQTGVLVRRRAAGQLLSELLDLARGRAGELLRTHGLGPESVVEQAGLYVLHAATFDARAHLHGRPPFEQVQWLRDARVELAWRIGEHLSGPLSCTRREAAA